MIAEQEIEGGGRGDAVRILRPETGVRMPAGIAELDDVAAPSRSWTGRPDFPHRIAKGVDKAIVMQGRIFEGRHALLADADGRRYDSRYAGLSKALFKMHPGGRYRAVIIGGSSSDRRTQYPVCKTDIFDPKRFLETEHGGFLKRSIIGFSSVRMTHKCRFHLDMAEKRLQILFHTIRSRLHRPPI